MLELKQIREYGNGVGDMDPLRVVLADRWASMAHEWMFRWETLGLDLSLQDRLGPNVGNPRRQLSVIRLEFL